MVFVLIVSVFILKQKRITKTNFEAVFKRIEPIRFLFLPNQIVPLVDCKLITPGFSWNSW